MDIGKPGPNPSFQNVLTWHSSALSKPTLLFMPTLVFPGFGTVVDLDANLLFSSLRVLLSSSLPLHKTSCKLSRENNFLKKIYFSMYVYEFVFFAM